MRTALKWILVILIVVALAVGFVVADTAVKRNAEIATRDQIMQEFSSESGPAGANVKFDGFPFVKYFFNHKISSGTLQADNLYIADQDFRIAKADLSFDTVYLPKEGSGKVDSGLGTFMLSYDELSRKTGNELSMYYAGDERVGAKGNVEIMGTSSKMDITFGLELAGNEIRYKDVKAQFAGFTIPEELLNSEEAQKQMATTLPEATGLTYESLTPTEEGLVVGVSVSGLELPA